LFLKSFVNKNIPWVHLDVYAWNASASAGTPQGGEAMGIRTVFEYLVKKYTK
jgi:leucyl aminopeptidase